MQQRRVRYEQCGPLLHRNDIDAELFGKVNMMGYSKQMKAQLISSKPSKTEWE